MQAPFARYVPRWGAVFAFAVGVSACATISITADQITPQDTEYIAVMRQETLEKQPSKKRINWRGDSVRGMMLVIATYQRSDAVYCRRILETVNHGFSKKANVISTWCRTGTGDTKWEFYQ